MRALLFQGEMGSRRLVVGETRTEEAFQVAVVEYDDVIEALAPDRADQALDIGILPGRARGGKYFLDGKAPHPTTEFSSIDAVAVAQ